MVILLFVNSKFLSFLRSQPVTNTTEDEGFVIKWDDEDKDEEDEYDDDDDAIQMKFDKKKNSLEEEEQETNGIGYSKNFN